MCQLHRSSGHTPLVPDPADPRGRQPRRHRPNPHTPRPGHHHRFITILPRRRSGPGITPRPLALASGPADLRCCRSACANSGTYGASAMTVQPPTKTGGGLRTDRRLCRAPDRRRLVSTPHQHRWWIRQMPSSHGRSPETAPPEKGRTGRTRGIGSETGNQMCRRITASRPCPVDRRPVRPPSPQPHRCSGAPAVTRAIPC